MRKNQKYSQEEMYAAIEHCKKEGLSHPEYCKGYGIPYPSFKYWTNKYKNEHSPKKKPKSSGFVPLELTPPTNLDLPQKSQEIISITYPNGIQVTCPVSISSDRLRSLINV